MATFNAIVCARERHLGAEIRRGVLYTSDQAHHSVLKSAKLAGIMPDRVRAIASDDRFRLRVDRARRRRSPPTGAPASRRSPSSRAPARRTPARSIRSTRSPTSARAKGCGTTSTARTARSSISREDLRGTLRGLPRADSLTLDPHKGMFLPYGTGALLVRDGAALRAAHEATADYLPAMPHPEDFYDPSQHGPELSRGFPGLRVWLSVKLFGAAAFRAAIAEKRALTLDARRRVAALPGHRDRRRAGAVAVRVPPDVAGRVARRRGRGDARAHGADDRARPRHGDRLHRARPRPRPRVRAQLPHASTADRRAGRGPGRVDSRPSFRSRRADESSERPVAPRAPARHRRPRHARARPRSRLPAGRARRRRRRCGRADDDRGADARSARAALVLDRQRRLARSRSAVGRRGAAGRRRQGARRDRRRRRRGAEGIAGRSARGAEHDVGLHAGGHLSDAARAAVDRSHVAHRSARIASRS